MYQKKIRFIFGFLTVIFLTLFLSGCKSAEVKTMEDSVSIIQLTTGREVERYTTNRHVALGKPVYPEVLIIYEPINNHTNKDVYDEIVAILKKNNWEEDESYIVPNYFWATLQQGGFKISAIIANDSKKIK